MHFSISQCNFFFSVMEMQFIVDVFIFFFASLLMTLCFNLKLLEPRHDKTKKVTVRPAKTRINLGIRPV